MLWNYTWVDPIVLFTFWPLWRESSCRESFRCLSLRCLLKFLYSLPALETSPASESLLSVGGEGWGSSESPPALRLALRSSNSNLTIGGRNIRPGMETGLSCNWDPCLLLFGSGPLLQHLSFSNWRIVLVWSELFHILNLNLASSSEIPSRRLPLLLFLLPLIWAAKWSNYKCCRGSWTREDVTMAITSSSRCISLATPLFHVRCDWWALSDWEEREEALSHRTLFTLYINHVNTTFEPEPRVVCASGYTVMSLDIVSP